MHLTEIGVIFLLESSKFSEKMLMIFLALCFSRAGDTGVGGGFGGHAPSLQNTSGKLLLQSDKKCRTYEVCLNQCWPLSE